MAVWAVFGSKAMDPDVPVSVFLLMRLVIGSAFFACVIFRETGNFSFIYKLTDIGCASKIFISGLLAQYASPVLYFSGALTTPGTMAAIFDGPVIPLMVFVIAVGSGVEKLPDNSHACCVVVGGLGMAAAGAGLLVVVSSSGESGGSLLSPGVVKLFFEALAPSCSLIIQKDICHRFSVYEFSFMLTASAIVCCSLHIMVLENYSIYEFAIQFVNKCLDNHALLLAFLYNVVAVAGLNMMLLVYANTRLPSSIVSMGACMQPVIALFLEVLFHGVHISYGHFFAVSLVFGGIKLFSDSNNNAAPPEVDEPMKNIL